jgi:3'(2'), 5'-bisphosphate nucleotidase
MDLSREKEAGLAAVTEAMRFCGKVRAQSGGGQYVLKDDRSPLTVADLGSQAIVRSILEGVTPGMPIIAEEKNAGLLDPKYKDIMERLKKEINDDFDPEADIEDIVQWIGASKEVSGKSAWILDPVDGTKGFLRGGNYAVALALMIDGRIVLGFLGGPELELGQGGKGCIFVAERGSGAYRIIPGENAVKEKIRVSTESDGAGLRFVESVEEEHADHGFHKRLCAALRSDRDPLRIDSQIKYGLVASGAASAYLRLPSPAHPEYKQKIWDHAAGVIIVEEAGGVVTDSLGNALDFTCGTKLIKNHGIIATNGRCHERVLDAVKILTEELNGKDIR